MSSLIHFTARRNFWSFCVRVFNLRSCHLRQTLRPRPSMQSHSRMSITTQMAECYWSTLKRKLPLIHLAITRNRKNWDREKSAGQAHMFNTWIIEAMDWTSGQLQVNLGSRWVCCESNSLKFHPSPKPAFRLFLLNSVTTFTLVSMDATRVNSTLLLRE